MIAYAAIDLRGGRVVQLVGGVPGTERVSLPDPAAVARTWIEAGFNALHVVDLDAALGEGSNEPAIEAILTAAAASGTAVQVGGGVRTDARIERLLARAAARVVVGTRAIEEPAWLAAVAGRWPGRILVAMDVRGTDVLVRGWTASAAVDGESMLRSLAPQPIAGVLITDVSREGRLQGVDAARFARFCAASPHPVIASGGVTTTADLALLDEAGAAGVVLGMALYTGAVDASAVAVEYAS